MATLKQLRAELKKHDDLVFEQLDQRDFIVQMKREGFELGGEEIAHAERDLAKIRNKVSAHGQEAGRKLKLGKAPGAQRDAFLRLWSRAMDRELTQKDIELAKAGKLLPAKKPR